MDLWTIQEKIYFKERGFMNVDFFEVYRMEGNLSVL